jgi:hypothetical protein
VACVAAVVLMELTLSCKISWYIHPLRTQAVREPEPAAPQSVASVLTYKHVPSPCRRPREGNGHIAARRASSRNAVPQVPVSRQNRPRVCWSRILESMEAIRFTADTSRHAGRGGLLVM